jgi:hypothetical protein
MEMGSTTCIPVVRRAVPESWGTSNGTFQTKKDGQCQDILCGQLGQQMIHLKPDIVEYAGNGVQPFYDLFLDKQTVHDLREVLDF